MSVLLKSNMYIGPEPMLASVRASGIYLSAISQEIPQPPITEISLKIIYVKFNPNLPGANELNSARAPIH